MKTPLMRARRLVSQRAAMIRHSEPRSVIVTTILALLVVSAPLYFAGVMPVGRALLQALAFLALASAVWVRGRLDGLRHVAVPLGALLAVAVFGLLQSLPWPVALVRILSPETARLWLEAAELQGLAAPGWVPFSVAPSVTRLTALQWLAVAACLAACCIQAKERAARRILMLCLGVSGLFQVLYGADRWLDRSSTIWGMDISGDLSRLRGTFVNPDHLAFYLQLLIPCCAAGLFWGVRKAVEPKQSLEQRVLYSLTPFLLFSFFFAAAVFTGSRSGLVALIGGLAVQGAVLSFRYKQWRMIFVALGALGIGLAAAWNLAGARVFGRWAETSAYEITWNSRLVAWNHSLELVAQSPIVGSGLGTFRQAFPRVQPVTLPGSWRHAHSDVLELAVTMGLPFLLLLLAVLPALTKRLWTVLHKGRRSEDRMLALAVFGAVASALLHSLVDFSLTMPANAFTLAVLVGLGCGTPELVRRKKVPRTVFLDKDASAEPLPADQG